MFDIKLEILAMEEALQINTYSTDTGLNKFKFERKIMTINFFLCFIKFM